MRLLLDEMLGPRLAGELRDRGLDVAAVVERNDLRALPDDLVLEAAREEQRVLVTLNVADFARLHQQWIATGRDHHGLVMITTAAFPQNRAFLGAVVGALVALADSDTLPGANEVCFLGRQ